MITAAPSLLTRITGSVGTFPRRFLQSYGLVLLLVVFVIVIAIRDPSFIARNNLTALVYQWAPVGIMCVGSTFVIIAGGFDLSVGGTFALSSVIVAALATRVSVPLAFAITVCVGMALGVGNGIIVTKAHVNP